MPGCAARLSYSHVVPAFRAPMHTKSGPCRTSAPRMISVFRWCPVQLAGVNATGSSSRTATGAPFSRAGRKRIERTTRMAGTLN